MKNTTWNFLSKVAINRILFPSIVLMLTFPQFISFIELISFFLCDRRFVSSLSSKTYGDGNWLFLSCELFKRHLHIFQKFGHHCACKSL